MRGASYETLESPDHVLDPLRDRIAELRENGRREGLIATRVETQWAESTGVLWWKIWTQPREVLVFEISWLDNGAPYLYDDGVVESADVIVKDLLGATVTLYGDTFEIRWLTGDEFSDAKNVMGVTDL